MHRLHVVVVATAVVALGMILAQDKPPIVAPMRSHMKDSPPPHASLLQQRISVGQPSDAVREDAVATDDFPLNAIDRAGKAIVLTETPNPGVSLKKCVAEFVAMIIFVFLGCGSAMSIAKEPGSAWVLQVSLTFGLAITVLAYAIGHYSGGQINCAVTFGLVILGKVSIAQGLSNLAAQLLGSLVGATILVFMYGRTSSGKTMDKTGGLGTNGVNEGWSIPSVLVGEFIGTFVLMYVVLETAINPDNAGNIAMAPVAIGLAVFLAHSVLVPIDGCSINPTRSFGPAVVGMMDNSAAVVELWIFWVGPLLGAAAAAGVYSLMGKV